MSLKAISFINDMPYDLVVYDSSNPDNPSDAENNYLGLLTSLGTVTANSSSNIMPLQPGSAFVIENASLFKPVKRCILAPLSKITSFTVNQADEDAITTALKFINFTLDNPNDSITKAFNTMVQQNGDDLKPAMEAFFQQYPDYATCTFPNYMMGLVYAAQHPDTKSKPPAQAIYSLSTLVECLGGSWHEGMADITISNIVCSTKDNVLDIKGTIDISNLPFKSDAIRDNVRSLFVNTTVKAEFIFNYAMSLGIFGTRLKLAFENFTIPAGSDQIKVNNPTLTIDINPLFKFVLFNLQGVIPFNLFSKAFDANISLAVDNDEAAVGVTIDGDNTSFPAPSGLKGLHFDEFGVGMAIFFKPPGFALGVQGKFHIGEPNGGNVISLNDDTFAVVCEYVGEAVKPKYLAFSVPKLDLNTVVELFTNANPKIDVPVEFSDLSFHWSDGLMDSVVLPDGSLSPGGYGFSAYAQIFSFGFYGQANLDINSGLTANMEFSPIIWHNVLKFTGDGKGYSLKLDANGNPIPNNFMPTTQAEKDALANATSRQIIPSGGANLIINTLSMPILHVSAKVSLFDLLECDVTADINKDGIKFELDFGTILTEKMVCNLSDFHNLYGEFGYYIDKSIPLTAINGVSVGSIPLKADTNVHITITSSLSDIVISVGGQFDFEGYHFTFGDFSADINISKISDFVGAIIQYIKDEAKTIFNQLTDTAEHWAVAAGKGIITGFDDAGNVMKNAYGKSKEEAVTILKAAGFAVNDVVSALKNGYNASKNDIASAMKEAGYVTNDVANGLKSAYNATADEVTAALKAAGYAFTEVATAIKDVWECAQKDVARVMKAAGYVTNDVANGLKSAYNATADDVTAALKAAGYTLAEVATAIKDVWDCAQKDVARVMKEAGYVANDVANGLKSAYNATADDVTAALKAAGYTLTEVATAIKDVWECELKDVARVMKEVGYVANDICTAFKSAFNSTAQDVGNAFKAAGIIAQDTANAIKTVYNVTIDEAASVLKQAGYAANDVASALQSAFNTSVNAVADAMKQVGYAADDVKNAFESLGGDFKSFADSVLGDAKHYLNPSNW
ncbi:hypothetical protein [Mucilaginibacter sp.]|uniref:hypothetical protein n=1 Tax=Mucilaginibacter sp. TaxID=1882438 RepID=UPI003B00FE49